MSNRSIAGYHLNTFTIRISRRFSSAREFQMGDFQKYWSQNVGQDFLFIVLDFFVGGISCGRKRCMREINVSRAWDPVHAGDKALTRETPAKRGRVNRYVILTQKRKSKESILLPKKQQKNNQKGVNEWVIVVQCQLSIFQLYHGEKKIIFNEMMIRSALY